MKVLLRLAELIGTVSLIAVLGRTLFRLAYWQVNVVFTVETPGGGFDAALFVLAAALLGGAFVAHRDGERTRRLLLEATPEITAFFVALGSAEALHRGGFHLGVALLGLAWRRWNVSPK